jgi:hypothetical protein
MSHGILKLPADLKQPSRWVWYNHAIKTQGFMDGRY